MKYSNTALKELSKRYRNILIKCALINAIALTAFSASAFAQADSFELQNKVNETKVTVWNKILEAMEKKMSKDVDRSTPKYAGVCYKA